MNRRGNLNDLPLILSWLFSAGMILIVLLYFINVFNDGIAADDNLSSIAKSSSNNLNDQAPGVFDFLFAIFFIGLPIVSAALAFFNDISPIFFFASLALIILFMVIGASYQQVWENANNEDTGFRDMSSNLPITNFIMSNFALYTFFVFVIIASGTFIRIKGAMA